jgi:glutathionyl-hydroquinone reductase
MIYPEQVTIHKHDDGDGQFHPKGSQFRRSISRELSAPFPAEKDRYALYMNLGCPWAHRTNLVRSLKGLDSIIQLILCDFKLTKDGRLFTGEHGSAPKDPLYGFTALKQLYLKADPRYEGRCTVTCLWDKRTETIANNESSEIIRMMYTEFDDLLSEEMREGNRPGGGFYPAR